MPFYGLSRRVHGVNNTLTACTVLSIYVRMSQRTCTILCKHSRLPQGLYCHHVCRCWKPNFAANDTRFIFLLRCYPSGEHGDKHCPCLKFVLFRVILNDPSASDKWHCVWNARRCRRFCCPYFIVDTTRLLVVSQLDSTSILHAPASFPRKLSMNNLNTAFVTVSLPVLRKQIQVKSNETCL